MFLYNMLKYDIIRHGFMACEKNAATSCTKLAPDFYSLRQNYYLLKHIPKKD